MSCLALSTCVCGHVIVFPTCARRVSDVKNIKTRLCLVLTHVGECCARVVLDMCPTMTQPKLMCPCYIYEFFDDKKKGLNALYLLVVRTISILPYPPCGLVQSETGKISLKFSQNLLHLGELSVKINSMVKVKCQN